LRASRPPRITPIIARAASLTAGGCMLWCAQAKFQEHKRVSQMYQLQLDEEKRAAKGGAEAPANPLDK
jgi:hypothetical protein